MTVTAMVTTRGKVKMPAATATCSGRHRPTQSGHHSRARRAGPGRTRSGRWARIPVPHRRRPAVVPGWPACRAATAVRAGSPSAGGQPAPRPDPPRSGRSPGRPRTAGGCPAPVAATGYRRPPGRTWVPTRARRVPRRAADTGAARWRGERAGGRGGARQCRTRDALLHSRGGQQRHLSNGRTRPGIWPSGCLVSDRSYRRAVLVTGRGGPLDCGYGHRFCHA
jgi:hypothetical protein